MPYIEGLHGGRSISELKDEIKSRVTVAEACEALGLERSREADKWACAFCESGHRQGGTGAMHVYADHFKCYSCGKSGDIFDLVAEKRHMDPRDLVALMRETCDLMGLYDLKAELGDHDRGEALGWEDTAHVQATPTPTKPQPQAPEPEGEAAGSGDEEPDYSVGRARAAAYVAQCQARISDPAAVAYIEARGFTLAEAQSMGWGYDPQAKCKDDGYRPIPRIVQPWPSVPWYYQSRDITDTSCRKYDKPYSKQVGPQPMWDPEAVKSPVYFIVEGSMDAYALHVMGHPAVALASNHISRANMDELAEAIAEAGNEDGIAVLMLDNDEAGREGTSDLGDALTEKGVAWTEAPVEELGTKDAGELFKQSRPKLAALLTVWHEDAVARAEEIRAEAWAKQMQRYHVVDPAVAVRELYELKEARAPISTGFEALDRVLGGGLHAKSLHIIGAQSSEGKTTLTLQVADHIAKGGHPVLFVTIEQRPSELIAKSLSRTIWQASGGHEVLSALDILNPLKRSEWHGDQLQTLACARDAYAEEIAPHMLFMDPDARPNVDKIEEWARLMAERYGEPPCVLIDYLQLLLPESERDSDKTTTDKNVTALRRMAGKLNTPVWVVASLNRQSYTAPIATDSFKESGAIEYGADVLMGLEPFDLDTRWHNETEKKRPILALGMHDKTRRATKRWMDLRILKNRFGSLTDYGIPFLYQANADTFKYVRRIQREKRNEDKELAVGGEIAKGTLDADEWDF